MSSSLSVEQLRSSLAALGVDSRGHRSELRSRLRKHRQRHTQQSHYSNSRNEAGFNLADTATSWRRGRENTGIAEEAIIKSAETSQPWKPLVHSFLVLDVEATCERGKLGQPRRASFDFPNEIIEFPVVLLRWRTAQSGGLELYTADTFHSYVKPVWRPTLTQFCKDLTGIEQHSIDHAPSFAEAVDRLHAFLASHHLLQAQSERQILTRRANATPSPALVEGVSWVCHGPHDLLAFVVKQSFISGLPEGVPNFLRGPLIDVKFSAVEILNPRNCICRGTDEEGQSYTGLDVKLVPTYPFRDTTVDGLLALLDMTPFEGRHHSGLDDTRNIARIFAEVGRRVSNLARQITDDAGIESRGSGVFVVERQQDESRSWSRQDIASLERATLLPNTKTERAHLRRWAWMAEQPGKIVWDDPAEL